MLSLNMIFVNFCFLMFVKKVIILDKNDFCRIYFGKNLLEKFKFYMIMDFDNGIVLRIYLLI